MSKTKELAEYKHIVQLWKIRASKKISRDKMAKMLDVHQKSIEVWEFGNSSPSFYMFIRWCQLLEYNPFKN